MLSRVADSIYWMARYVERAENVARFIHVNLHMLLDLPMEEHHRWSPLVSTSGDLEDFEQRYGEATQENVIRFLAFDPLNPNSIVSCLRQARENARSVREVISSEMWEQINRLYLLVQGAARGISDFDSPHTFYTEVKLAGHEFTGITESTMSHNEGWHFARMGRLFERADKTSRILDVKYFMLLPHLDYVGSPYDALLWAALLRSASAFEMYHKLYHGIAHDRVAEFLILNREFPRSIHFCLLRGERSLHAVTGSSLDTFTNTAEQLLGRLRSEISYARIGEIIKFGLHEYLDTFQAKLNQVGMALSDTFFAQRPVPLQNLQRTDVTS